MSDPRPQHATPRRRKPRNPKRPRRPWWLAGAAVLGAAATVSVVALFAAISADSTGPTLTHTVTRGDLVVTVLEQGLLESEENKEVKCKVRGRNTVIWVIESGSIVEPGDVLVRLDTLFIDEQIDERTKYAHWSRSSAERSAANVVSSRLAVEEYEQGTFVTDLMKLETALAIAEARHTNAENMLSHARLLAASNYTTSLDLKDKEFAVRESKQSAELLRTQIEVLKEFTKAERLQTLKGNLTASEANHDANAERATADASRRDRALEEQRHCVVRAERGGIVIHPSAARWKNAPEIEEGATVHKDQVMLLMPDLKKMQVNVGIHESVVDRVEVGQDVRVTLPNQSLDGVVSSVASVTKPAGWWSGNEVRYDTFVRLPPIEGLRPGMSAEVEVIVAEYKNVLTIPVAAAVETDAGSHCWVATPDGPRRRMLLLGDSNTLFTVVEDGLEEGDQVLLNPRALDGEPEEQDEPSSGKTRLSKESN